MTGRTDNDGLDRAIDDVVRQITQVEPPSALRARVMERIHPAPAGAVMWRRLAPVAVLAGALAGIFVMTRPAEPPAPAQRANVNTAPWDDATRPPVPADISRDSPKPATAAAARAGAAPPEPEPFPETIPPLAEIAPIDVAFPAPRAIEPAELMVAPLPDPPDVTVKPLDDTPGQPGKH
jgi:hypothetical protein